MSFLASPIMPKDTVIRSKSQISTHLYSAATSIDRISLSFNRTVVQGNFGFVQTFRNVVPILNMSSNKTPKKFTDVRVQYHGLGSCWAFSTRFMGTTNEDHWLLEFPKELEQNEARRAHRFFLNTQQSWSFASAQAFGTFILRDLSTLGCSFFFDAKKIMVHKKDILRGLIQVKKEVQIPVMLQVRHINDLYTETNKKLAGCSFEKIADWGRMQIDDQLQAIPNSDIRRI